MAHEGPGIDGSQAFQEGKVMALSGSAIERRLIALEKKAYRMRTQVRIHEAETIAPAGDATNDFVSTHSGTENFAVFVAPVRLHGVLQVRRASAAINTAVVSPAQGFALAVYKYSPGPQDSVSPLSSSRPYNLRLVAILGAGSMTGTSSTRLNLELTREIELRPSAGEYFVAYQTTEYGKWFCPGDSVGTIASRRGRKTGYLGEYVGDFPEVLTVTPVTAHVPWVALRSTLGIRLYGDITAHDGD